MRDKDDVVIYPMLFGGLALIGYAWFKVIGAEFNTLIALAALAGACMTGTAIWIGLCPQQKNNHIADINNMVEKEFEKSKTQDEPHEVKAMLVTNYKRKSVFALISGLLDLGVAALGIAFYYGNKMHQEQGFMLIDSLSSGIKAQFILSALAAACLISGYVAPKRSLVLIGAILSSVAMFGNLIWFVFLVLPIVFAWVGYARMRPTKIEYR